MKFNFITLTALSCICLGLSSVAPAYSIQGKGIKGGDGHHDHSMPHPNAKPERNDSTVSEDNVSENSSEVDHGDMIGEEHEGNAHHGEMSSDAHGGANNDAHQGGMSSDAHGGAHHDTPHGGTAMGHSLFHHGSVDVSEVFHLSMAHGQEPSIDMALEIPSVMVIVHPDTRKGWNVEVQTEHFAFAPEQVNQANQPNVGHGHLYVNGEKVARLYGSWFHLENLESGRHEITVSLHANGHEVWTHEGEAIAHTTTVEVP